jgi:hypothetical protein
LLRSWEVRGGGGGSFLTSDTISNPAGNADATRDLGVALSVWLDNNIGSGMFGGELRYDHESGDLKLSSAGTSVKFSSQSNALHYDVVVNFGHSESTVRPFVAAGAGVKFHLSKSILLRLEAHDYPTQFPSTLIAPAIGSSVGGWLNDLVAQIGIGYAF